MKTSPFSRLTASCARYNRVLLMGVCVMFVTYVVLFHQHDFIVIKTNIPRLPWLYHDTLERLTTNVGKNTPIDPNEAVPSPLWRIPIDEIKQKSVKGDILNYLPEYKNPCWFMDSVDEEGLRCLPYVHLAGVAKSGTTAFFEQMIKHPDIEEPGVKETHFWTTPMKRNMEGYLAMFSSASRSIYNTTNSAGYHQKITFDATSRIFCENGEIDKYIHNMESGEPIYTLAHTLKALYPKTKIIVTFRNPTDRLFSEYHFHMKQSLVALGKEYSMSRFHDLVETAVDMMKDCLQKRTVRSCLYDSDLFKDMMQGVKLRLNYGMYAPYVKEWLSVFPRDQFMFIKAEDLYAHGSAILRETFKFLDLSEAPLEVMADIDKAMSSKYNTSKSQVKKGTSYKTKMWTHTRKLLDDFYRPYNEELATLLGDPKWLFEKRNTTGR